MTSSFAWAVYISSSAVYCIFVSALCCGNVCWLSSTVVWLVSWPCSLGLLDMASAFKCLPPTRWTMVKLYSCSCSSHLANWPSSSWKYCSHCRELWSVLNLNVQPSKYGLKLKMKVATANSSFLVTQYSLSALLRVRLAYAITFSWPLYSCERTAPIPSWLASVSKINCFFLSGKASTGAFVNLCLRSAKALAYSVAQVNKQPFSVRVLL